MFHFLDHKILKLFFIHGQFNLPISNLEGEGTYKAFSFPLSNKSSTEFLFFREAMLHRLESPENINSFAK